MLGDRIKPYAALVIHRIKFVEDELLLEFAA